MNWSDVPRNPTPRTLRQFAGLCLLVFGASAAWQMFGRQRPGVALALGLLAVGLGAPGLVRPSLLRPVFVGWMVLAFPVGWVVSRLLMAALYFTVFTPAGLVSRALGRDPLGLKRDPGVSTYWATRPPPGDPSRYLREY